MLGLLLWALPVFGEKLMEVPAAQVCDYLEGRHHFLFLDAFSELVAVAKTDRRVTRHQLKGSGPKEITVPLSLTPTPDGPVISGLFYQILVRETPEGVSLSDKARLPVRGPLVHQQGRQQLFGTAVNYWDDQGQGYSAVLLADGAPRHLLPFENPIGARHPRAFAAISRSDRYVLFGQPVTLDVHLLDLQSGQTVPLPLDGTCIQRWSGQKPADYPNLETFANSWDRFLANGSWLHLTERHIYAVVSVETSDCADALSFLWVLTRDNLKVIEWQRVTWHDERPLNFLIDNGTPRWLTARDGSEHTHIYLK